MPQGPVLRQRVAGVPEQQEQGEEVAAGAAGGTGRDRIEEAVGQLTDSVRTLLETIRLAINREGEEESADSNEEIEVD